MNTHLFFHLHSSHSLLFKCTLCSVIYRDVLSSLSELSVTLLIFDQVRTSVQTGIRRTGLPLPGVRYAGHSPSWFGLAFSPRSSSIAKESDLSFCTCMSNILKRTCRMNNILYFFLNITQMNSNIVSLILILGGAPLFMQNVPGTCLGSSQEYV